MFALQDIESMNNDSTTLKTEDTTKYLTEAIPKTFTNINLTPTSA
jgi:hypothetical protein